MKLRCKLILIILLMLLGCFYLNSVEAITFNSIFVQNYSDKSIITIRFNIIPEYKVFLLNNPNRIVMDFYKISKIDNVDRFPIKFIGNNLITCIRSNFDERCQSTRVVCDLCCTSNITTITQKKIGKDYCIILIISKKMLAIYNDINNIYSSHNINHRNRILSEKCVNLQKQSIKSQSTLQKNIQNNNFKQIQMPIIVAIDAGHGGQDPGATGYHGIHEKHITFSIAKRLKKMLDMDPMFKAVMIRSGDYFLSVTERSDLARKKKADILISIHTDSALNSHIRGASVWVLSSRRAQSETIHWLHRKDKHSELLGGLGDVLSNYKNDPYFEHLVLDLQFGYAQREGYNIAMKILNQLKNISFLHKNSPEYSSFGILRSPDIPSVLVETGFISNFKESCLLKTHGYQEKIAQALYKGLCGYVLEYSR